jgi:hypothetical protein
MKTRVIQSYRAVNVPAWIDRCLESVRAWSLAQGFDHHLVGDECFQLCGEDYLSRVGDNIRSITNLARLILVRQAHDAGYDRAIWIDADVLVFAPEQLRIDLDSRYAFAREGWVGRLQGDRWKAFASVNNSVFACMAGEPDLDFLIAATRHIALHRRIHSNFQVGGDLIRGLRASLDFQVLDHIGMFSDDVVSALAQGDDAVLRAQARVHGAPVYAANLCASANYSTPISDAEALAAIDTLARTRGEVVNRWLSEGPREAMTYPGYTTFVLKRAVAGGSRAESADV